MNEEKKLIEEESEGLVCLNVSIPVDMKEWLKRVGKRNTVSMSFLTRKAIAEYRKKVEGGDDE